MTRRSSSRPSKRGARPASGRRAAAAPAPTFLTPARKRELSGAALVALAVVTLVSFVSQGGRLTQWWVGLLETGFGWGRFGLPILLGGIGAWFIVDSMDDRVEQRWSRPVGALGLYLALLGILHLGLSLLRPGIAPRIFKETGVAGGAFGYALGEGLRPVLGAVPAMALLLVLAAVSASFVAGLGLVGGAELLWRGLRQGSTGIWQRRDAAGGLLVGLRERLPGRTGRRQAAAEAPLIEAPDAYAAADGALPPEIAAAAAAARQTAPAAPAPRAEAPSAPAVRAEWQMPDFTRLLEPAAEVERKPGEAEQTARTIERTLAEFGVPVEVVQINPGPTITQFGLKPGYTEKGEVRARVKVSRIVALQNDLALSLAASPVRILAPVPGRPYVGVEVPNASKAVVSLRGVMESEPFRRTMERGGLPIALGRDTSGNDVAVDLTRMPHLLVAGATGAGKSVCINALICSLLLSHTPETLKLVLVDPKRVEMTQYRGLPHLATPVIVEAERVVGVLQWAVREMDRRYRRFAEAGARNLETYNQKMAASGQPKLPFLVIIIDELADLMMLAPDETERLITRLAQLARATGIHLVLATQRPSVDVVTGLIKANFPSRIAFAVSSSTDSRVILDSVGADKLLGQGDMLYMASDDSKLRRLQGCYVSDEEIVGIVRYWKYSARVDAGAEAARQAHQPLGIPEPMIQPELWDQMVDPDRGALAPERDALWDEAVALIREHGAASTSFLQRKLRIGYSRAARLIDELEEAGLVGPAHGNTPREVLAGAADAAAVADDFRSRLDKAFETRPNPLPPETDADFDFDVDPDLEILGERDGDPAPARDDDPGFGQVIEPAADPEPGFDSDAGVDAAAETPVGSAAEAAAEAAAEPGAAPRRRLERDREPDETTIRPWIEG